MKSTALICIAAALFAAATLACAADRAGRRLGRRTEEDRSRLARRGPGQARQAAQDPRFRPDRGLSSRFDPLWRQGRRTDGQEDRRYTVTVSHDMGVFTPENLAQYDAVLFNNTTQLKFNDPKQRDGLARFHQERQRLHRHPRGQRQLSHLARGGGDDRRAIRRPSLGSAAVCGRSRSTTRSTC